MTLIALIKYLIILLITVILSRTRSIVETRDVLEVYLFRELRLIERLDIADPPFCFDRGWVGSKSSNAKFCPLLSGLNKGCHSYIT